MTSREMNAKIKATLKEFGYCTKDFKVTVSGSRYDTIIKITVKNPLIRLSNVENAVKGFKEYETDVVTGEILQGGSTFVFVKYDIHAFDNLPDEYAVRAQTALEAHSRNRRERNCPK